MPILLDRWADLLPGGLRILRITWLEHEAGGSRHVSVGRPYGHARGEDEADVRVLGVDVGERRIGLALSDPTGTLASPLTVLTISGGLDDRVKVIAREIDRLVREEEGLARIVVGLPVALDGQPHAQTERVTAFVEGLRLRTSLPVAVQDERLSSREAERRLAQREKSWRQRKLRLDAAAAAIILQDYLDEQGSLNTPDPERRAEQG